MPASASPDDMVQTAFAILREFIESPPLHPYQQPGNISLALASVKHICEVRTALALAERDEAAAQRAHVERLLDLHQVEALPWYKGPQVDVDEGDIGGFLTQLSYGLPDLSQSDGDVGPSEPPVRVKREDPSSGGGRHAKRRRDDGEGVRLGGAVGPSSPCAGLREREGDAEGNARGRGRDDSALPMPETPTLRGRSTPATPIVMRRAVFPGSGGVGEGEGEGEEEGVLVVKDGDGLV